MVLHEAKNDVGSNAANFFLSNHEAVRVATMYHQVLMVAKAAQAEAVCQASVSVFPVVKSLMTEAA